jgi:hypothetical protein
MTQPPEILDIVALVTNNPLIKLSNDDYQSKIIQKIKERFTDDDQQLFVANFYCYLNYNNTTDFVINLDRIWKWMAYSRIEECKRCLVKNFKIDIDYKIEKAAPLIGGAAFDADQDQKKSNKNYFPEDAGKSNKIEKTAPLIGGAVFDADQEQKKTNKIEKAAPEISGAGPKLLQEGKNLGGAGLNKETILLTINCFKKLCLKSKTTKADQIHDYYIQLEEIMNEIVSEQSEELKHKLLIKDLHITNITNKRERTLLNNFNKKPILYIGYASIFQNEIKFGYSDDICTRITEHKKEIYPEFTLEHVYESVYNREIERRIKKHHILKTKIISKVYDGRFNPQTEIIQLDSKFTINDLDKIILEIKEQVESREFDNLTKEILELESDNNKLKLELEKLNQIDSIKFEEINKNNNNLKLEVEKLKFEIKKKNDTINNDDMKIINIQLNSMEDLNTKLHEIKKAVCYNFLVDIIAQEIISNGGKSTSQIKLSIDEIFKKYEIFRTANNYKDPIYDEKYEKSIITKAFNDVDGIKNTYKTIDGVQFRAKLFFIDKISNWICENIQIPKRFRSIFREISKEIVFVNDYCEILNKDIIAFKYKTSYSFLIHLIIKYKSNEQNIVIKNTILNEDYLKFMLQFEEKKLTIAILTEILTEIPGISNQRIKNVRTISIIVNETIQWIIDTLEIPDKYIKMIKS